MGISFKYCNAFIVIIKSINEGVITQYASNPQPDFVQESDYCNISRERFRQSIVT